MPNLQITMPSSMGGHVFDMNPFTSDKFAGVATFVRNALTWLLITLLAVWVFRELGEWVKAINQAQQAKGNAVVGGTGAQATALAAAGLITAAVIIAVTALLAWGLSALNVGSLIANLSENPMSSAPAGVYAMVDAVFPVGVALSCLIARATFSLYATGVYSGVAAAIRFFVP